ncbi:hypothetical protein RN001_013458 [Aquatica leii]|uniref:Cap-specific mRNA (nucleoside-2'-O-)-methyltransferase 1 n=1 Tax=Aquatica leii TaxID=1421715 RepID=A0AAN7QD87_9COLE|nr:hypothetical protein RN001_013458 [Aquatica leii]
MFKGFGFILKCDHDFELYQSHCASPVSFSAQYGVHGDGNICRIDNIEHFFTNIRNECEGLGVHFMMSDGGFSVEGNENLQEILSKQLYVCQCLMALEIVRPNGHFVTKLFDLFTLFSVGLIFLMCKCFDKISILKPNASRPANSERYLLCYGLKNNPHTDTIRTYLASIATKLWDLREARKSSTININEIVPLSIIKSDDDFCEFLTESNNKIGRNQIIGLEKLGVFGRNARLVDPRQDDLRTESLRYWRIPDVPKLPLPKCTPDDLLKLAVNSFEFMNASTTIIDDVEELNRLANTGDWLYALSGCTQKTNICNFYVDVGDSRVYRWQCSKWVRIKKLLLIRGTLLYREMINEKVLKKVDDEVKEVTKRSLHVIDALRMGDTSLADLSLRESGFNLILTDTQQTTQSSIKKSDKKLNIGEIEYKPFSWEELKRELLEAENEPINKPVWKPDEEDSDEMEDEIVNSEDKVITTVKTNNSINLSKNEDTLKIPVIITPDPEDIKINNINYRILYQLGKGSSCIVYNCLNVKSNTERAIKLVNLNNGNATTGFNEIKLLKKLQNCDRIIKMYDYEYVTSENKLMILLEKGGSDLGKTLKDLKSSNKRLPLHTIMFYSMEMLYAVQQIHINGIVHADLKPANFLHVVHGLKLIDFGIASRIQDNETCVARSYAVGTINYISPEALIDESSKNVESPSYGTPKFKITYKSDVWSLGCIFYELMYGKTPFDHIREVKSKLNTIMNPNHKIEYPVCEGIPKKYLVRISNCLQYKVKNRLSISDLIKQYEELYY